MDTDQAFLQRSLNKGIKLFNENKLAEAEQCFKDLQNKKKTCEKCFAVCSCNNVLVLDTKLGRFRTGKLCASCSSLYASKQPIKL